MKVRTVLYADEGTVLTNGTDYGTVIWLAEGVDPNAYYAIPMEEYEAVLAAQEAGEHNEAGVSRTWS